MLAELKTETPTDYGMRTHLDLSYEEAIDAITAALKEEGFGVLTEIDVKATLKKKIDADFRKYAILGVCNPALANQALNTQLEIGLLLPCNVIVYEEEDGGSTVSIIDPAMMLGFAGAAGLTELATDARAKLSRALAAVRK